MRKKAGARGIAWKEWSKEAFEEAKDSDRLVLLDLSAEWCHWCHVMDRTTYSDPDVIDTVNREFLPVRVDIDSRPDISERYNRGGFPTTAFLSDQGESIWGATYIPPKDMKRILSGILTAKATGEVAQALQRSRTECSEHSRPRGPHEPVAEGLLDPLFEDILATYDTQHGGFGLYPKFPHPDVTELLIMQYLRTGDEKAARAAQHTIASMAEGLYDPVEGGVFRYSVTRDWRQPHYEKMLETNTGFLRNLVALRLVFGSEECAHKAEGVVGYLLSRLRDPETGGFRGSQDADEDYYKLPAEGRASRRAPAVVRTIYSGWNSEAISALVEAGSVFKNRFWLEAAAGAWDYTLSRLWNPTRGLIRHEEGVELYLFEDQVAFLGALLSMYSMTGEQGLLDTGHDLVSAVESDFVHDNGGFADILHHQDAVGELGERRRSLVANSKYSRALAIFAAAAHDPQLASKPAAILDSFSRHEVEMHGLFGAEFVIARRVLSEGVRVASVAAGNFEDALANDLWNAATAVHNPAVLCTIDCEAPPGTTGAVVCTAHGCSERVQKPEKLAELLRVAKA